MLDSSITCDTNPTIIFMIPSKWRQLDGIMMLLQQLLQQLDGTSGMFPAAVIVLTAF